MQWVQVHWQMRWRSGLAVPCDFLQDDVPRVLGMDWTKVILLPTLGVCREAGPQGRDTYTGYITILFGLFACWEVSEAGCCCC